MLQPSVCNFINVCVIFILILSFMAVWPCAGYFPSLVLVCMCLFNPWSLQPTSVLCLLILILSVSMWRLISQIAASQWVAQLSPSRDAWPAHTNLHTKLNLHTYTDYSHLRGAAHKCTHMQDAACVLNTLIPTFFLFFLRPLLRSLSTTNEWWKQPADCGCGLI